MLTISQFKFTLPAVRQEPIHTLFSESDSAKFETLNVYQPL